MTEHAQRGGPKSEAKTRKDILRTGSPLWLKTPNITVSTARHLTTASFDVIVVGAGISGALVAEALTALGNRVLVVDRRKPVRGSTPASTAMIQHEIDVPLTHLHRQIGPGRANSVWLRSARAVHDLVALVARLGIDCQMRPKAALYLAGTQMGSRALAAEAALRASIGIDANYLSRADVTARYGMDRPAAILSSASASANPAQLTAGLLDTAVSRGAQIVSDVEVTDIAEMPGGVALATREGRVLVAGHAVFCTGYEYLRRMESKSHSVTSTWALASKPLRGLPDWLRDTIVWEASDPYLYFRTDEAGRIIAGGEDEKASDTNSAPEKLSHKAKVIAGKIEALTGIRIGKPAYTWSAPFGTTKDGLPIIDRVPGHDRILSVMGFGGNGITFSMIAAQIVSGVIAGSPDPDAELFTYR